MLSAILISMPVLERSSYNPSTLLPSGHLQTIYPYFFRRPKKLATTRIRLNTPDGDFLDLDISQAQAKPASSVVILTHGLEGNSQANYVTSMAAHFNGLGVDAVAWNMRGCSGEMNLTPGFYHSGQIEDLDLVVRATIALHQYKKVYLIGFSLGAGMTAMYLGKAARKLPDEIEAATVFSTPCCLYSSGKELSKIRHKFYAETFLSTMRKKVIEKDRVMGLPQLNMDAVQKAKTFEEFDNAVTAPLLGLKNAMEYYQLNSCNPYLTQIERPTLIVNALNDPFLGKACYPIKQAKQNSELFLEMPPAGGHLGFVGPLEKTAWTELRAENFLLKRTLK